MKKRVTTYQEESNLRRFDLSVFLHFIGRMLYMTFIPIVLLKSGYSLTQVFLYLIGFSALTLFFLAISAKFFSRKNVLVFYVLAIIAEIFMVILLIPENISYVVLSLIIFMQGAYYSYYYISYNSIVAHYTSRKRTSNNLGNLGIAIGLSNIVAPIVGAVLLSINKYIFIVAAMAFLLTSIIPLIRMTKTDIDGSSLKKVSLKKISYELFSCSSMNGIGFVTFLLWTIFIYLSGFSLIYVGLVPAIEAFVQIILLKTIKKKLFSLRFRMFTEVISVMGIAAVSVYRFFIPSQVLLTNFLMALFFVTFYLGVNSDFFEKVRNYRAYHSSILLETAEFIPWILISIVAFVIGLKYSILIPVAISAIWIAISSKRILKSLKKKKTIPPKNGINPRHTLIRKV